MGTSYYNVTNFGNSSNTFKNYKRGVGYMSGGFGKSQALETIDDPFTAIEKGGLTVSMAAFGFLIKKGGKEIAEESAEEVLKYVASPKHAKGGW